MFNINVITFFEFTVYFFCPRQVDVACLLLAFLSATVSASWIFPDGKQPTRESRDDERTQEDLKLLSLVSGQPPSTAAHHGLKLLRHLLQAQRNKAKVPRSLDTPRHLVHYPAGSSSSHGSLIPEQFQLSKSCCTGTGFKPSTYFATTALRNVDVAPYKHTTTTTHKPVQIYNAINVYKPIFNSQLITTYRPDFTSGDVIVPAPQYAGIATAKPAHSSVVTRKPAITIYRATTAPSHIDTPPVTTYRPKYNHIHIPTYKSTPDRKYKSTSFTSTVTSHVSTNKPQYLTHGDHVSTKVFKPKRQVTI